MSSALRTLALVSELTLAFTLAQALPVMADELTPKHAAGREVYLKWCAPCHAPGITHPGTHALMTKYQGVKSGVLLEWIDLPAGTVKYTVRHGISVMPQFRKTEINDAELDALAQYLSRNTPRS
jgi:mono/diheme cytochrome c family protein